MKRLILSLVMSALWLGPGCGAELPLDAQRVDALSGAACLNDGDLQRHEAYDLVGEAVARLIDQDADASGLDGLSASCAACYESLHLCALERCSDACEDSGCPRHCGACVKGTCLEEQSACVGFESGCGNGVCEASEDASGCPADCVGFRGCELACLEACGDAAFACEMGEGALGEGGCQETGAACQLGCDQARVECTARCGCE